MNKHKRLKRQVAELEQQMERMFAIVQCLTAAVQQVSSLIETMPREFGTAISDRLVSHTALTERNDAARSGAHTNH